MIYLVIFLFILAIALVWNFEEGKYLFAEVAILLFALGICFAVIYGLMT